MLLFGRELMKLIESFLKLFPIVRRQPLHHLLLFGRRQSLEFLKRGLLIWDAIGVRLRSRTSRETPGRWGCGSGNCGRALLRNQPCRKGQTSADRAERAKESPNF